MNELNIFENPEFGSIRTTVIDDEPWFVGKDVCEIFGDTNYRRSLNRLDDEDKSVHLMNTPGGTQQMTIINESGLYSLMFYMQPQKKKGVSDVTHPLNERVEKLKRFKRWVTSEVLPAIRKTGTYIVSQPQRSLTTDDYLKAALIVSRCKNERLPYVLNFLQDAGFSVPKVEKESIIINRGYMDDSVVGFLDCYDDIEVENIPTRVVYSQYADYCGENNLVPLCSGEFSKQVKRICNMSIISKNIKGKTYRIFIKN